MSEIKSYTDLEQSKKLAEILPIESADMGWNVFVDGTTRILPIDDWDLVKDGSGNVKFYHAWSLAALLSVLPKDIIDNDKKYFINIAEGLTSNWLITYDSCVNVSDYILPTGCENPVDACVAMIEKLHELNLL